MMKQERKTTETCYTVDNNLADSCYYLVVAGTIEDAGKYGTVLFALPDEVARQFGVDLATRGIQGRLRAEMTKDAIPAQIP